MNKFVTAAAPLLFALLAAGSLAQPASAHEVAVRCTSYGCDRIVCNYTGDRCYREHRGYYSWNERPGYRRERWDGPPSVEGYGREVDEYRHVREHCFRPGYICAGLREHRW